jgi:mannose-1-phosphate guanylyltransferase/mannose-6-phosphate isomerase
MIIPVILSGGAGTRLWPVSRAAFPKQFATLLDEKSLLQHTLNRACSLPTATTPVIVSGEEHRFIVAEQLQQMNIGHTSIILEPLGRNTAPALALAAMQILSQTDDAIMWVLPADHIITNLQQLHMAAACALAQAQQGYLVTFGIMPTRPETGYGYIQRGDAMPASQAYQVKKFVEKPDFLTAQNYIDSGEYYWNSGMFMFQAKNYLEALEQYAPDILDVCRQAFENLRHDGQFLRIDKQIFANCRAESIDYAIMEKAENTVVVPLLESGWSDIGSWDALAGLGSSDHLGNVTVGDVVLENVSQSYIHSTNRMVAAVGVQDHIIVETHDVVLVAHKNACQDVKKIVSQLTQNQRSESELHRKVYRPWGSYDSLQHGNNFQVKHITVKPGASLSLQLHHHRSEHWVIVSGVAEVTKGEEVLQLTKNQSVYIEVGEKHRLRNIGENLLELIEVQVGSYLGEDDIVRFEDNYNRV